ncbi:hypothetical protein LguiB_027115 [Lonicera macranthoides]
MMVSKSTVPLGFRFKPTKEEIFQFLWLKINGQELPCGEGIIEDLNVYDERQLEEIFLKGEKEDEGVVYTFMRLKNKSKNAKKQKDRTVGKGTWKSQQTGKLKGFGKWREFRYENSGSKKHNHKWNMTEYFLNEKCYPHLQDYVISKIKRKGNIQFRDEKAEIQENEEEGDIADDSFAQELNNMLMSPASPELETAVALQCHNENLQVPMVEELMEPNFQVPMETPTFEGVLAEQQNWQVPMQVPTFDTIIIEDEPNIQEVVQEHMVETTLYAYFDNVPLMKETSMSTNEPKELDNAFTVSNKTLDDDCGRTPSWLASIGQEMACEESIPSLFKSDNDFFF